MIKYYTLEEGQKPTPEQIAEVRRAATFPITFDEDCPPLTDEQLKQFHRRYVNGQRVKYNH